MLVHATVATLIFFSVNSRALEECGTEMISSQEKVLSTGQTLEDGSLDRWPAEMQHHLTYCVSDRFFSQKEKFQQAIAMAAQEWMQGANVTFIEVNPEGSCSEVEDEVLFVVEKAHRRVRYNFRAFFPSSEPERRTIKVNPNKTSLNLNLLVGYFRHELGHVLGFRHEHAHPDAPSSELCLPENSMPVKAVTPFDEHSVMMYPICGGRNLGYARLSEGDIAGAQFLYP